MGRDAEIGIEWGTSEERVSLAVVVYADVSAAIPVSELVKQVQA